MDINDKLSIDSPIDNKNIIEFITFRTDTSGIQKKIKAYQIAKHIWVVPERYYAEPLNISDEYKIDGGIYNENYLTTDKERQEYLDAICILFKRINNVIEGKKLLSLLSSASPFPFKDDTNKYLLKEALLYVNEENFEFKFFTSNIILFGPGTNISKNQVLPLNGDDATSGVGSVSEICYNPFFTKKFGEYSLDPVIGLIECLLKSLYNLYGIKVSDDIKIPYKLQRALNTDKYSYINLEEALIFGGNDYKIFTEKPYWLSNDYFLKSLNTFEENKAKYEKDLKNDPNLNNELNQYLQQKYSFSISKIWSLNLTAFADIFNINIPTSFLASITFWDRSQYYKINYPNDYNIDGFVNGQWNTNLKNIEKDNNFIIFDKPKQIITYINDIFNLRYTSNLYEDNLDIESNNYYLNFMFEYDKGNNFTINQYKALLDTLDNDFIDSLPPIQGMNAQNKLTSLPIISKGTDTENINSELLLPIHYLKSQTYNLDMYSSIKFTTNIYEVVSEKNSELVYTFLPHINEIMENYSINNTIKTEEEFYNWMENLFINYSIDILEKRNSIIPGITAVLPWIGKALNILNTNNDFEEELQLSGIKGLIKEYENFIIPDMIVPDIPLDNMPRTYDDIDKKLSEIYTKNKFLFLKGYYFIVQEWWTTYYIQFIELKYLCSGAINKQQQLLITVLEKQLFYFTNNGLFPFDAMERMINEFNRSIDIFSRISQQALNNVDIFINECALFIFNNEVYPLFLNNVENNINKANDNVLNYINKATSLTEEQIKELTVKYTFSSIAEVEFFNESYFKKITNMDIKNILTNIKNINNLILSGSQINDDITIFDESGNNLNIKFDPSIRIVDGHTNVAFKLDKSSQYINIPTENINFSFMESFSIDFWLKILDSTESTTLLNCIEDDIGWKLSIQNNNLLWEMKDNLGNNFTSLFTFNINNIWHNITLSIDRLTNTFNCFLDGKLINTDNISNIFSLETNTPIEIQSDNGAILLEAFSILNYPLQQQEVLNRYREAFSNNYTRNYYGDILKYNENYQLYNKTSPDKEVKKVFTNDKDYIAIEYNQNTNNPTFFSLIQKEQSKIYVEENDEVYICVQGDPLNYITIDNNQAVLTKDINLATSFKLKTNLNKPNSLIFSENSQALRLSNRLNDENYILLDLVSKLDDEPLNIFYWEFI
ncbi:putative botulinum neurotoxin nontoxic nonhemagglutinin component [Clostridium botulinum]|uniref:Ntnh/x n=1 Tax=Clostridium botulinum TaxID=1491 RepID=A0A9Y2YAG0_CLOBO|nr:non-toxic nonhemagglutinin NTNH [Clostridium botulinum]8BYP_N Chain N, NTNH/X [Clostridium botulinum]BAQ12789.1 putative botulinum neurotoxin nontoxic nonhemagglutinin component [Clostridium botulinum]